MSTLPKPYVTHYSRIKNHTFRAGFRHIALSGLATYYKVSGRFDKSLTKNRIQILYSHCLFEDENKNFRQLLATLSRYHQFISYSEAVQRIMNNNIDAPYLAFSFDDGFKNNVYAAEIMNEFGIRACFFICPSIIGQNDQAAVSSFCRHKLQTPPIEFLNWQEIDDLLKQGHEIGSHTMTHQNMSKLSREQVQYEISSSFETLTAKIGKVEHFSWPFGRFTDFSPEAAEYVFEAGFKSCASAVRGCHFQNKDNKNPPVILRRDHIIAAWPVNHILYFMSRNCRRKNSNYPLSISSLK